jgi:hypothetical protein
MANHYEHLDDKARGYADEVFSHLEAGIQQRVNALPEGQAKERLNRRLSMVRGECSPVPVIYLDTPVIENIIRHALGEPLPQVEVDNARALYETTVELIGQGKFICPEDSFHREALAMPDTRSRKGLDVMRGLSMGLSFKHSQSIEDFQVFRAIRGFIQGEHSVSYRKFWYDAFVMETVDAIMRKRATVTFEGIPAVTERDHGQPRGQEASEIPAIELMIRFDKASLKKERQLQQTSTRHLRDLVRLGMKYQSLIGEAREQHIGGFWAAQKVDLPLALWKHYGGNPPDLNGLISFYESAQFGDIPTIRIKRDLWHALSSNERWGLSRQTMHADVNILSAVLPYTDIMILGSRMTRIARDKLGLDAKFNTAIYSTDEHDLIMEGFREIAQ